MTAQQLRYSGFGKCLISRGKPMSLLVVLVVGDGVQPVDALAAKCCQTLDLGEIPDAADAVPTSATEGGGATSARQEDLVKRLRAMATGWLQCHSGPCGWLLTWGMLTEAADEIAALRARVDVLESESMAARRLLTPDGWSYPVLTSDDVRPYANARRAVGKIGGVA